MINKRKQENGMQHPGRFGKGGDKEDEQQEEEEMHMRQRACTTLALEVAHSQGIYSNETSRPAHEFEIIHTRLNRGNQALVLEPRLFRRRVQPDVAIGRFWSDEVV